MVAPGKKHHTRARDMREAFSLLELSVVIAIVSVVAVMGLEVTATFMNRTAYQVTQERAAEIDQAIYRYRQQYGRLPCPAPVADTAVAGTTKGGTCYGKESRNNGSGNSCADYSIACSATAYPTNATIRYGTVPVRDLGLPLYYMTDGYGNLFTYHVTAAMVDSAPAYNAASDSLVIRSGKQGASCGSAGNVCQTRSTAAYAVLSNGKNGRGARTPAGGIALACIPVSTASSYDGTIDAVNCRYGWNLTLEASVPNNVLYDSRYNIGSIEQSYFDDIIKWRSKSSL